MRSEVARICPTEAISTEPSDDLPCAPWPSCRAASSRTAACTAPSDAPGASHSATSLTLRSPVRRSKSRASMAMAPNCRA